MYDFDTVTDRKNTDSLKYDFAPERGKPQGLIPLWVADMDFKVPEIVISALVQKAEHGIFGYSEVKKDYFDAVYQWFYQRFSWSVRPEWLVKTPGVVCAISLFIRSLTNTGDGVLIQQPVYYPFSEAVLSNGRKLVVNELVLKNGKYQIDFEDFEQKIAQNGVKLFVLCSPHNPVGRVWTKSELKKMAEICLKYSVFVVSDEIHCDFVYGKSKHTVFAALGKKYLKNCAVCTSPSKTFNLAGLQVSNIFIPDSQTRSIFKREMTSAGLSQLNIMGLTACKAAYLYGAQWFDELKNYLLGNIETVKSSLLEMPEIKLIKSEGTYLVWLDCRALKFSDRQLSDFFTKAGLWVDDGFIFGKGGSGFVRLNIACPRIILKEAFKKLKASLN